jgi:hypothetical protein
MKNGFGDEKELGSAEIGVWIDRIFFLEFFPFATFHLALRSKPLDLAMTTEVVYPIRGPRATDVSVVNQPIGIRHRQRANPHNLGS